MAIGIHRVSGIAHVSCGNEVSVAPTLRECVREQVVDHLAASTIYSNKSSPNLPLSCGTDSFSLTAIPSVGHVRNWRR